jgi:hypothetical protein
MRRVRDGLSTRGIGDPGFMDNFKNSSKQIERLAATLILTPVSRRLAHECASMCEVCWRRQRDRPFGEIAQAKAITRPQARDFFHES